MISALRLIASALGLIPGWVWAILWASALAGCVMATYQLNSERAAHADSRAEHAEQIARMAHAAVQAEARHNKTTAELANRIIEDAHDAQLRLAESAVDLADARRVDQQLRRQLAALAAASCVSSAVAATADGSASADAARNLLADVQRRLAEATDDLAGFADAASAAGTTCERAYDRARQALTP